jgi:membrane peptidoglycan carboxypeptidase
MSDANDKTPGFFSNLMRFIALSAATGIVATLFLTPAVGLGSFAIETGIAAFEDMPSYIKPVNASEASTIYGNLNGKPVPVASFYNENRESVPFNQISKYMIDAVISTEDPRFYQHDGVDWISLGRATLQNLLKPGGGPGASTITMQYVRNSLIEAATLTGDAKAIEEARAISLSRKLREMRLALALEKIATKQDILAGYLNLSFFGNQINGIEAASQYYFGVHAADLTLPQGAMLAAMLKSPNDYKPDDAANLTRAKGRRDYVIDNMVSSGYITQQEGDAAKATAIEVHLTHVPSGCEANQTTAFFCDYVVWTIRNSAEFGTTPGDRENLLKAGGLQIYTTMDLTVQKTADAATKKWAPVDNPNQIGSASVSVQAGTGRVLALAENRVFDQTASGKIGHTSVNYATDKAYGGSSGFQTGSTYKIFTLAAWLTAGKKLLDHVDGRVREWNATDFSARCGAIGGTWKPKNIGKEPEDVSVVKATALSENTAFVSMASQLDLCDIRDTAMAFGVHRADANPLIFYPSSVLGINEIAPITMAAAVAGVANHGMFCTPVAIDKVIIRKTNTDLKVPTTECTQAVSPEVAAGMTYAMKAVISGGTGGASNTGDGTPLAGKTGTTDSGVHTWMTGFSSAVGTATWVGNVSGAKSLTGFTLNGKAANTVRHDIWRTIMKTVNKLYPGGPLDNPPQTMIDATMVSVPSVSTQAPDAAAELIKTSDLNAAIQVQQVASAKPAGTVAFTKPAAGAVVPRGTQIKIYVSKGGATVIPDVAGLTVSAAKQALLNAGFASVSEPDPGSQGQFFQHSNSVQAGWVVGTLPKAGSSVVNSSAILLIISLGP